MQVACQINMELKLPDAVQRKCELQVGLESYKVNASK